MDRTLIVAVSFLFPMLSFTVALKYHTPSLNAVKLTLCGELAFCRLTFNALLELYNLMTIACKFASLAVIFTRI